MTTEQVTDVCKEIALLQAQERLRQLRETFDQRKRQDARWFVLKLAMGWTSVALLPGIAFACGYVIVNHQHFSPGTETAAAAALFADALGLVISVWRLVLGRGLEPLKPLDELSTASVEGAGTGWRARLGRWLRLRRRNSTGSGDRSAG